MCSWEEVPGGSLTHCNFTSRGDKSLAYDLVERLGRVRNRVVLLLRFFERQPKHRLDFFGSPPRLPPSVVQIPYMGAAEGGLRGVIPPGPSVDSSVDLGAGARAPGR